MPFIPFDDARTMTIGSRNWMQSVSLFIQDPQNNPAPTDIYSTQKLAFEIKLDDLKKLVSTSEKVVGILGFENDANTLSFILVGTDREYNPAPENLPLETFPMLNNMSQLNDVINTYLKP